MSMSLSYDNKSLTLAVNAQAVTFGYALNTATFNTMAGKVVQVLSLSITDMTVASKIGSAKGSMNQSYLQYMRLVSFCKDLMLWQAKTNKPARFVFPNLNYDVAVFLRQQTFTDNLKQVSFPYTLQFSVDEDINSVVTTSAMTSVFSKVKSDVGFVPGEEGWHGGAG